jgi:hypothetical protein
MKTLRRGVRTNSEPRPELTALLLPGTLLVTIGAQLLAPFMFINLRLPAFF